MQKINVSKVLERLKGELNITSNANLAEVLGVSSATVSTWGSRSSLDFQKIIFLCEEKQISLDWIFLGKGDVQKREFIPSEENKIIFATVALLSNGRFLRFGRFIEKFTNKYIKELTKEKDREKTQQCEDNFYALYVNSLVEVYSIRKRFFDFDKKYYSFFKHEDDNDNDNDNDNEDDNDNVSL